MDLEPQKCQVPKDLGIYDNVFIKAADGPPLKICVHLRNSGPNIITKSTSEVLGAGGTLNFENASLIDHGVKVPDISLGPEYVQVWETKIHLGNQLSKFCSNYWEHVNAAMPIPSLRNSKKQDSKKRGSSWTSWRSWSTFTILVQYLCKKWISRDIRLARGRVQRVCGFPTDNSLWVYWSLISIPHPSIENFDKVGETILL